MLNYISLSFSQFSPREFYLTSVLLRLYFRTILSLIQILYTNEPHYIMSEAYASLIICTWLFTTREFITTMYPFSCSVNFYTSLDKFLIYLFQLSSRLDK